MTVTDALIATAKETLYTAVLSDVLDSLGVRDRAMKPAIRPLDDTLILCGRARTGFFTEVCHVEEDENPYELEIALIDSLKPGDVTVFGCGASKQIAPWGELLSTASKMRGAVGAVTDGYVRDVKFIRDMAFPVFHGGIAPLDSRGRGKVIARDVPITCSGIRVDPGDMIFGDVDGVVAIPQDMAEQVVALALDKVTGENTTRKELLDGKLLADVYEKYGIL